MSNLCAAESKRGNLRLYNLPRKFSGDVIKVKLIFNCSGISKTRFVYVLKICLNTLYNTYITKTRLFKYIENFTTKNGKFSDKNSDLFHISAKNIDCGSMYSLEPPWRGGSNEYP